MAFGSFDVGIVVELSSAISITTALLGVEVGTGPRGCTAVAFALRAERIWFADRMQSRHAAASTLDRASA
jgi:hypothetical protein